MEKMLKPLNPLFQLAASIWILFVAYSYFDSHPEYFGGLFASGHGMTSAISETSFLWEFLLTFGIVYFFWVMYQINSRDKDKLTLNLTPLQVLGIFTLFLFAFADFYFLNSAYKKQISFLSAQISLVIKLLPVYLTLFGLTLVSFAGGKKALRLLRIAFSKKLIDSMVAIGLGLGLLMLGLFGLGSFNAITPLTVSILALIFLGNRETIVFLKRFCLEKFTFETRFFSFPLLFLVALALILSMNVIDLLRPMPIGWDDMGVYLNYPKLVAETGSLLPGQMNNYFLIGSIPFVLIKNEYVAATVGMFVSFWGGVLALFSLQAFAQKYLKPGYGILLATLIYSIPMTMHQSSADMKTDLILFFFMVLSTHLFLKWFFDQQHAKKFLILSGIFAGIAFGIKPTAILLLFSLALGVIYKFFKWPGALALFLLEWIAFRYAGAVRPLQNFTPEFVQWGTIGMVIVAIGFLIFAYKKYQEKLNTVLFSLAIFACSVGIVFSPWAFKNLKENHFKFSFNAILNGQIAPSQKATVDFTKIGVPQNKCVSTARNEELDRYLGYDEGIMRYLSLPWKVTMNTTVHGFYLDISFLFLSFVPLALMLLYSQKKNEQNLPAFWKILIATGFLSIIIDLVQVLFGYEYNPLTEPSILGLKDPELVKFAFIFVLVELLFCYFVFSILIIIYNRIKHKLAFFWKFLFIIGIIWMFIATVWFLFSTMFFQKDLLLLSFSLSITFIIGLILFLSKKAPTSDIWGILLLLGGASWLFWLLVGNGVIWYGIFGFILLLPLTAYFFYENQTLALQITAGVMVILSLFSVLALRGTKYGNDSTIAYAYGVKSALETVDGIVPDYRKISCIIQGKKWDEKQKVCFGEKQTDFTPVYRIGTFIPYFIPNNHVRLFNDPQLDTFKCIDDSTGQDNLKTMQKLKTLGYKFLIFDLNTATIEKDPHGSLHQKATRFVEWVNALSEEMKMYVHVYSPGKGIAFMEITDKNPIEPQKKVEPESQTGTGSTYQTKTETGGTTTGAGL